MPANVILGLGAVPILGPTIMRLRQFPLEKRIFQGGVARKESLPLPLAREMYRVGNRRGHARAFLHAYGWPPMSDEAIEKLRRKYAR